MITPLWLRRDRLTPATRLHIGSLVSALVGPTAALAATV